MVLATVKIYSRVRM